MSVENFREPALAESAAEEVPLDVQALQESFVRRLQVVNACSGTDRKAKRLQQIQLRMCEQDSTYFFNTFAITYNPKLVTRKLPAYIPFDLWPRQEQLLRWLDDRVAAAEEGLVEKSRDIGWTWLCGGYALHKWLFVPGFRTTFGSRKLDLVDKLGDPDSIFEKMRLILYSLPEWMRPDGYRREKHDNHCKITNPVNGNVIGGEAGDNMGRGGRATLYLLDEFAYVEHADTVAAAVLANADCRIYGSSVNGPGSLFARKRHDGSLRPDQIFTFHWRDDPRKDEAWARRKRQELSATPWMWAQEYDIDYTAAVEGICVPAAWVNAALKLSRLIPYDRSETRGVGGLDIGDGCARSVLVPRFGPLIAPPVSWGQPDTTNTALQALERCRELGLSALNFDTIGVGKGVLSTLTLAKLQVAIESPALAEGIKIEPVNVGRPPTWYTVWPDGQNSRMKFANLKAELWWLARERFKASAEHYVWMTGEEVNGVEAKEHDVDDVFLFEDEPSHLYRQLIVELSQPKRMFNTTGKILIESKQQLADRGVASPDHADALVLSLLPTDHASEAKAVSPVVVVQQRGYQELSGGPVGGGGAVHAGGYPPAVSTGKRFDKDFSRDW